MRDNRYSHPVKLRIWCIVNWVIVTFLIVNYCFKVTYLLKHPAVYRYSIPMCVTQLRNCFKDVCVATFEHAV
jgi:hypothetical protein